MIWVGPLGVVGYDICPRAAKHRVTTKCEWGFSINVKLPFFLFLNHITPTPSTSWSIKYTVCWHTSVALKKSRRIGRPLILSSMPFTSICVELAFSYQGLLLTHYNGLASFLWLPPTPWQIHIRNITPTQSKIDPAVCMPKNSLQHLIYMYIGNATMHFIRVGRGRNKTNLNV